MGFLASVTNIAYAVKAAAKGKAVIITTKAAGGQERTTELYHPPGLSSGPTKEDRAVGVVIGTGKRVAVATHNYRLEIEVVDGETILYSTDPDGLEVKGKVSLDTDGNISLNDGTDYAVAYEDLQTQFDELNNKYNKLIQTLSGWTPVLKDGGTALKTALQTATPLNSAADITQAKVDDVRLP